MHTQYLISRPEQATAARDMTQSSMWMLVISGKLREKDSKQKPGWTTWVSNGFHRQRPLLGQLRWGSILSN